MPVRFQVDPDFYDHPKVLSMSDAAFALWVRAGSYCVAKATDGFVADDVLSLFSKTQQDAAPELVRRRLWRRVKGGFQFHQYSERNLMKARVEADREYDRERKQRQRKQARQNEGSQVRAQNVPVGHRPDVRPDSDRNPNRSVSVSVSESVSGSGHAVGVVHDPDLAALVGPPSEPPRTCEQHRGNPNPPPCGACGDARRGYEQWHADRRERQRAAPDCRRHRGQPAHNCAMCRSEALGRQSGAFPLVTPRSTP